MLNEAGLKAAVRAAQETVFGNGVPVWEDDFPPIHAAITAYLASVQGDPKPVAEAEIADAVLGWMVKYDLLDAENEYQAADVLAVLDDLTPSTHPVDRDSVLESASTSDELVEKAMKAFGMVAARERLSNEIDPEIGFPSDKLLRRIHLDVEARGRKNPAFAVTVHHRNIVLSAAAHAIRKQGCSWEEWLEACGCPKGGE